SAKIRVLGKRASCRKGVSATGTDGDNTVIRFDQIAISSDQKGGFVVGDNHDCFEMTKRAIGSPILGEFHSRAAQVPVILLEFRFKPGKQSKAVGGRTGKPGENLVVVKPSNLARSLFDDGVA